MPFLIFYEPQSCTSEAVEWRLFSPKPGPWDASALPGAGGGVCVGEMQLGMIGPVTPGTARASSEHPG